MYNIQFVRDLDINSIQYGDMKILDSGMKAIPILIDGNPIIIQTPECIAPYGINCYKNDTGDSYALDLSFRDMDNRPTLYMLYDKLEMLDHKNVNEALKNSQNWLKKKASKDVIEALYTPIIKHAKDKIPVRLLINILLHSNLKYLRKTIAYYLLFIMKIKNRFMILTRCRQKALR